MASATDKEFKSPWNGTISGVPYGRWALFLTCVLFIFSPFVIAHDSSFPREGCPPVEEEIVELQLLGKMLADTSAIGLVTKVRLKKGINKLLKKLEIFHDGKSKYSLKQLEEQYDLLLMKIAVYLQDDDPGLHSHVCNAWLPIWQGLSDFDHFHEYHL